MLTFLAGKNLDALRRGVEEKMALLEEESLDVELEIAEAER